jgi:hypothetical protein
VVRGIANEERENEIESAVRASGILLILGLTVELISLLWAKSLAFLLFVGAGGLLTLLGMVLYLYSLIPSGREKKS